MRFQQEESDIGFPGGNGPVKALTYYVYGSCPNCSMPIGLVSLNKLKNKKLTNFVTKPNSKLYACPNY